LEGHLGPARARRSLVDGHDDPRSSGSSGSLRGEQDPLGGPHEGRVPAGLQEPLEGDLVLGGGLSQAHRPASGRSQGPRGVVLEEGPLPEVSGVFSHASSSGASGRDGSSWSAFGTSAVLRSTSPASAGTSTSACLGGEQRECLRGQRGASANVCGSLPRRLPVEAVSSSSFVLRAPRWALKESLLFCSFLSFCARASAHPHGAARRSRDPRGLGRRL